MDKKAARKLRIGQRVEIWAESPDACSGTVTEKNWMAIRVEWDDGQVGIIHLDDCRDVSSYYGIDPIVPASSPRGVYLNPRI